MSIPKLPNRRQRLAVRLGCIAGLLSALLAAPPATAWDNVLKDPGFEGYRLNPRGFYEPQPGSGWQEITLGRGSVQFDASVWKAPKDMLRERPLGFSPGTTGCEGTAPDQNTGRIILQQDVVDPDLFSGKHEYYEAWMWLGGGGRDDDGGTERKDEAGGWEIFFYGSTDPSTWKESEALEYHHMTKDFWGEPGSFVQVAGFGKVPSGTKGFQIRVWATTWSTGIGPAAYNTEVAIDNAHFALIGAPNMLINGNFELDDKPCEFKGWHRPAAWPFPRNGMKPHDINNVYKENFDHGQYRPFYGARCAYGYTTYLCGWGKDAFTFSQFVDYDLPDQTPLQLMLNWIQGIAQRGKAAQLKLIGTNVEIVVEYLRGQERLGSSGFWLDWPVPPASANLCRYDQNEETPYSPRFYLEPPAGTERIGLHVNFIVNMPYHADWSHVTAAVDDFFLVPTSKPAVTGQTESRPGNN